MRSEIIGFGTLALMLVGGLVFARWAGDAAPAAELAHFEAVQAGGLTIADVWIAEPVPGQPHTAAYLRISNQGGDERLLGVRFDGATMSQIHRTVTEAGMTSMEPVDAVIIPGGGEVAFVPGHLHIMLMGLTTGLRDGDQATLILAFLEAGDVSLDAPVRSRLRVTADH